MSADASRSPILVWFRNDLRLNDNPALSAATETGRPLICFYVLERDAGLRALGGAARWWLDKSLRALRSDISERGGKLICRSGHAAEVIDQLIEETGAGAVYWGRRYTRAERALDAAIKSDLTDRGIEARSFNTTLLTDPWSIETKTGGHYKVFTPYWKALRAVYSPPEACRPPTTFEGVGVESERIEDWGLHPQKPDWSTGFEPVWEPGEQGARRQLEAFLEEGLGTYHDLRNRPDREGTSRLSPHLRFGEISPAQIWRAVQDRLARGFSREASAWTFLSEVVWREFSYVLLYHHPDTETENYNPKFDAMAWRSDDEQLQAWQRGQTGYPIVDAGMRQLWKTGWMHNRVRMIVASFLTKHLLIHWREGEAWFHDTLVDADPASNVMGWQWTAGSGADAAPYFRVFNPISQGEKFDATGAYVRRWCPELAELPKKYLHAPWTAPAEVLEKAGLKLGQTYPRPIIEHTRGRERALDAYNALKEKQDAA